MMRVALFWSSLAVLLAACLANPYNANGVCNVNDIGYHGPSDPTTGPIAGVTIAGIDITTKYVANKAYTITLTGSASFDGFVLYATRGTIALSPTGNAATLAAGTACGGLGLQHNDNKPKTKVVAVWTAPSTAGLKISFGALLVKQAQYAKTTLDIPEVGGTATTDAAVAARAGASLTYTFKISVLYDVTNPAAFAAAFPIDMAAALGIATSSRITVKKTSINAVAVGDSKVTDVIFSVTNPATGTLADPILMPDDVSNRIQSALTVQAQTQTGPLATSVTMQAVVANSLSSYQGSTASPPKEGMNGGIIALIIVGVALVVVGTIAGWCYCTRGRRNQKNIGGATSSPMITSSPSKPAVTMVNTSDWTKVFDDNTKSYYYFNSRTNESSWTKPPGVNL